MTMPEEEVVKTINHTLPKAVGNDKFLWTTLQIKVGTVGRRHGRADATGTCITFHHGKNDGAVTLDKEAGARSEVGHACAHDFSLDVHLGPFSGFRVVVTAVLTSSRRR